MACDLDAVAGDQDLVQVGGELDAAADGQRVHRVVAGVQANVVVPGQPQ